MSAEVIDSTEAPDKDDPVLDFEGINIFALIVTATDSEDESRSAKARVTVRLKDLNEAPYFDKESRGRVAGADGMVVAIEYTEARTNAVVRLAATEPDGDSLRWEVTGTHASRFEIKDAQNILGDGKDRVDLHFKSQPDYENGKGEGEGDNDYMVTVRATETSAVGGGPNKADEVDVMVEVMNSDEPGMVEIKWLQPEVGTPLPATLIDPDGDSNATPPIAIDAVVADATWQWYRAKNQNPNRIPTFTDDDNDPGTPDTTADWEVITGEGALAAATSYTPQGKEAQAEGAPATGDAMDEGWLLLARASYTDGQGDTKTAIGVTAYPVRADVHDDLNNSPDFRVSTATRSVPETTAVGDPVGAPVVVLTNEDNDILSYEILTTDAGENGNAEVIPLDAPFFSIDKATGQIMVRQKLNFEGHGDDIDGDNNNDDGGYKIVVRATDPSNETDNNDNRGEIVVRITATDVNEAPSVSSGMAEMSVDEIDSSKKDTDITKYVGLGYEIVSEATEQTPIAGNPNLYQRSDVDANDVATWPEPISGPDGRLFEYSTPGNSIGRRLHFKNPPDFESPLDANKDNVYEVAVRVVDTGSAVGTKNVRITVINVNEKGKLVITPEEPHDGMAVLATLTDPDGVEYITNWKWATSTGTVGEFMDAMEDMEATTDMYTGEVGQFLWAEVDYRDGWSVENDPVTALDERNDDPDPDRSGTQTYKLGTTNAEMTAVGDDLIHNSDLVEEAVADNSVRKDPAGDQVVPPPNPDPIEIAMMVKENVPSTGYVGNAGQAYSEPGLPGR